MATILLALCVVALASAGCGGGGDDNGANTASANGSRGGETTKLSGADAVLIGKADAICEQVNVRYRREVSKALQRIILSREKEDISVYEGIVDRVVAPRIEGETEELQALSGSPSGEEVIDRLTAKLQEVIDEAQADPTAFREGPVPAAKEAEILGLELGFEKCGSIA